MSRSIDPVDKHRREVWLKIVLPVAVPGGIMVLGLVALFVLAAAGVFTPEQITTMSSIMLTICILVPLILVALILNVMAIAMAWGTGKLPTAVAPPLRALRRQIESFTAALPTVTARVAKPVIGFNAWLTRWETFMVKVLGLSQVTSETAMNDTETKGTIDEG